MSRQSKLVGAVVMVGLLLAAVLYGHRAWQAHFDSTPEGYQLLAAMPSEGFEPRTLPAEPILKNQSSSDLAVNFGYKVGTKPYAYSMVLSFPDKDSDTGRATVTVQHASRQASAETTVMRRWDEPRKAYAVAVQDEFMIEPAVPSLCIKAVIGPDKARYDLKDASICIAQRDVSGNCHPETLACGLIR